MLTSIQGNIRQIWVLTDLRGGFKEKWRPVPAGGMRTYSQRSTGQLETDCNMGRKMA
jgi:hypothetical protein